MKKSFKISSAPKKIGVVPKEPTSLKKVPKPTTEVITPPPPAKDAKSIKAKLREVVKFEKKGELLSNRTDIENYISGLPSPGSDDFKKVDPKLRDYINIAYHKAETSARFLIVDSEVSGKARFELCKFFVDTFSDSFGEVLVQLCDIWKYRNTGPQASSLEDLYLLLCKSILITSTHKLNISVMLYNSGNLTNTYSCLEIVASDHLAKWEDRVEACKFLLTSSDPSLHSLSQEVLCEIIEDPKSLSLDKVEAEAAEEGSRTSATSSSPESSASSTKDSIPSFLRDSDEEPTTAASEGGNSEGEASPSESSELFKPKKKAKKPGSEERAAKRMAIKKKLEETREDEKWQTRTKIRYGIIADFLFIKKLIVKKGRSKHIIEVPVIKSHLNSKKLEPVEGINLREFILPVAVLFTNNEANHIRQRLMTASILYESNQEDSRKEGYEFLIQIGGNRSYIEDIRADALDMILRLAGPERSEESRAAMKMIIDLGREAADSGVTSVSNRVKTIYQNSQNVHEEAISSSVMEFVDAMDPRAETYSFSDIEKDLVGLYKDYKLNDLQKKQARAALYRCSIDHSLFGVEQHTVRKIFTYIWTVIENFRDQEEVKDSTGGASLNGDQVADLLERRFVDALVEMGDTCTTGHVARLVQVLDGYGVDVKISFKSQIMANVSGRITAIARDQKDPKIREIIDLGVMEDAEPDIRSAYTSWMRKELEKLEAGLWKEFKSHVKRDYFDEAFAEAAKQLLGTT